MALRAKSLGSSPSPRRKLLHGVSNNKKPSGTPRPPGGDSTRGHRKQRPLGCHSALWSPSADCSRGAGLALRSSGHHLGLLASGDNALRAGAALPAHAVWTCSTLTRTWDISQAAGTGATEPRGGGHGLGSGALRGPQPGVSRQTGARALAQGAETRGGCRRPELSWALSPEPSAPCHLEGDR